MQTHHVYLKHSLTNVRRDEGLPYTKDKGENRVQEKERHLEKKFVKILLKLLWSQIIINF